VIWWLVVSGWCLVVLFTTASHQPPITSHYFDKQDEGRHDRKLHLE